MNETDRHLPSEGEVSLYYAALVYFAFNLKCTNWFLCGFPLFLSLLVSSADLKMESAQVAFVVLVPVTLLFTVIIGIYLYFSK